MRTLRILFMSAALALTVGASAACAQNSGKGKTSDTGNDRKAVVTVLTEEKYRTEVADYTVSEWKFLGSRPAVVDFYADWCGPCRRLAPIMDKLAAEYAGKVDFYKVNVDNAQKLSAAYGIRSIPAVLFIPQNGEPQMSVGLMSEEDFKAKIDALLKAE